jgi:hypothetical protein
MVQPIPVVKYDNNNNNNNNGNDIQREQIFHKSVPECWGWPVNTLTNHIFH